MIQDSAILKIQMERCSSWSQHTISELFSLSKIHTEMHALCHLNENKRRRICPWSVPGASRWEIRKPWVSCFNYVGLIRRCMFFRDDQIFLMLFMKASSKTVKPIFICHCQEKKCNHALFRSFFHLWNCNKYFFTSSTQENVMMVQENDIRCISIMNNRCGIK